MKLDWVKRRGNVGRGRKEILKKSVLKNASTPQNINMI